MTYSVTWDETKPDDNNYGYEIDNYIRSVLVAVRERLATEHSDVSGTGGLATLMHKWAVTAKSTGSPYTVLATDNLLLITTSITDYTLNLPTAVGITGKMYKIKKVDSGAGAVIIDGATTETIEGRLTKKLFGQYDWIEIISDGSNWVVVNSSITDSGVIRPTARNSAINAGWGLCVGTAVLRATYDELFEKIVPTVGTPTLSIATPCVLSLTAHGLAIGDSFYLTTDGALPTGVSADTLYYVITAGYGANSFEFAATRDGTAINSSGTQSGTHTLKFCPYGLGDGSTTFNLPDFRQSVLMGKSASGTGKGLGETGGTIDHVHALSHTHSVPRDGWGSEVHAGEEPYAEMLVTLPDSEGVGAGYVATADNTSGAADPVNSGAGNQKYAVVNFEIKL